MVRAVMEILADIFAIPLGAALILLGMLALRLLIRSDQAARKRR